ncbi:MAG: hypothetical protein ACR2HH_06380 [Chthoniobacterales bacterium]
MKEESRESLGTYLQDHYAGAVGAIALLEHLSATDGDKPLEEFFRSLLTEVRADHNTLHEIMETLGIEESTVRNAGAWLVEKLGRSKLGFVGGEKSGIRLLQTLEALAIGITGKLLLWRALEAAKEIAPVLRQTDFDHLKRRAQEQLDRVEAKRLEAAGATFRLRRAGGYKRPRRPMGDSRIEKPRDQRLTKRDETPGSKTKGEFMDVKSDGKKFKGVAKEPDRRRNSLRKVRHFRTTVAGPTDGKNE